MYAMRAISLPAVPYDATAQRPDWTALPADLRTAVEARLGAPVIAATTAGGGFTRGFAAVLETATGDRAFVKAATLDGQADLADWYGRETAITAALPERVPAARPRWAATIAGHFAVCFDAIDGHMPELPWRPEELDAALAAWAVAAEELRTPSAYLTALGPPRLTDLLRDDMSYWNWILGGREPMPPAPTPAADRLRELAALEAALPGYAETTSVMHCDLRLDNVLIDTAGAAWICDWNWLCYGPAWFDTAALLITAYASGLDADARFAAHPTAAGAPDDALDAALAALAGFYLSRAAGEQTLASRHVRTHQRWSGELALAWLAERQGWR
jgi:aminoglycoside phosphotransferase (APT) family kinase protein